MFTQEDQDMNFTRAELKDQAKLQMEGKLGGLMLCCLVFVLICIVESGLGRIHWLVSIALTIFVMPVISFGWTLVCLNVSYGEDPKVATLFEGFRTNYVKAAATGLLVGIFTFLWSLLLIVPGIIMGLSYSQALFILAENPDMEPMECIRASKEMMRGRKMDLFVLYLSFIPWLLLVIVTCGLMTLYVAPYMSLTETNFYHRIKAGGDGTDLYGTVFDSVEDAAEPLDKALDSASDHVEDITGGIVDNITDKF